jgi:hypothetical protein
MALRRRRLRALTGAGIAPTLARCKPCGGTWTGVGFEVSPVALEQDAEWRVDAELTVEFFFGREGVGIEGAGLAVFDADGAVLAEPPVGDLPWSEAPEAERESDECGEYGILTRARTPESDAFPTVVGIRYDRAATTNDGSTTVARYPSPTPSGPGAAAR